MMPETCELWISTLSRNRSPWMTPLGNRMYEIDCCFNSSTNRVLSLSGSLSIQCALCCFIVETKVDLWFMFSLVVLLPVKSLLEQ